MPKKLFQKGQSGNPGGRPPIPKELILMAQKHVPEAINALVYWANKRDMKCASASVRAAQELLDRGLGKAPQPIAGWDNDKGEAKELVIRFAKPEELK